MAFTCSICAEESTRICVRCTKDACNNHLCPKCGRCSDCCECEVTLEESPRGLPVNFARAVVQAAGVTEPDAEPVAEPEPVPGVELAPEPESTQKPEAAAEAEAELASEAALEPKAVTGPAPAPELKVEIDQAVDPLTVEAPELDPPV